MVIDKCPGDGRREGGIDMVAVSWDVPSPVTATALERFRGYSAHEMMSETTRVIMERMA